jgi:glycosyltransferase involved in cell wall biosynthesis
MRRVLIVSHFYKPATNPRVFRWSAIAEHWAKQGHQIDIISNWMPGLPHNEVVNKVQVYRAGDAITEVLRSRLQKSVMPPKSENNASNSANTNIRTLAKWIHDYTWKKLYWPDCACLWFFPALKKAKQLLKNNHYHNLITVSDPFTSHLVGLGIKKVIPQVPWLVDIGDPFCFQDYKPTNNHGLYKNLNYATEREIFRKATSISVTTKPTLEKYTELFSESAAKIRVIPPLLSLDTSSTCKCLFFPSTDNKFRFVYIGTLHKQLREPDFLLELFQKLLHTALAEKIELHFIGNINNCQEYFQPYQSLLNQKIFCHGKLSRDRTFQAMKEADILVNIGNDAPYQLPSKVVEYASMGKPILNLAKIEEDSSMEFFKSYPISLCLVENEAIPTSHHATQLIHFIENARSVDAWQLLNWLNTYKVEAISKDYEACL